VFFYSPFVISRERERGNLNTRKPYVDDDDPMGQLSSSSYYYSVLRLFLYNPNCAARFSLFLVEKESTQRRATFFFLLLKNLIA
jgi:hypothetical protein